MFYHQKKRKQKNPKKQKGNATLFGQLHQSLGLHFSAKRRYFAIKIDHTYNKI